MMSKPPSPPISLDPRLDPPVGEDAATVRLQVPLRDEFASTVRVVVASLAADAGFSVDDIDDLRLAVSEVFSSFTDGGDVAAHDTGAVVDIAARSAAGSTHNEAAIQIATSSGGVRIDAIELDELATTIIRAAVDEFRIDAGVVTLVKRCDRVG